MSQRKVQSDFGLHFAVAALIAVGLLLLLLAQSFVSEESAWLPILRSLGQLLILNGTVVLVVRWIAAERNARVVRDAVRDGLRDGIGLLEQCEAVGVAGVHPTLGDAGVFSALGQAEEGMRVRLIANWLSNSMLWRPAISTAVERGAEITLIMLAPESDLIEERLEQLDADPADYESCYQMAQRLENETRGQKGSFEARVLDSPMYCPAYGIDGRWFLGWYLTQGKRVRPALSQPWLEVDGRLGAAFDANFDYYIENSEPIASS